MKLLLDTHIWLWSLLDPSRLPRRAARELASPKNELWLSPISVWETVSLLERGRLTVKGDRWRWLDHIMAAGGFRDAVFSRDVAARCAEVELPYRDPADRQLVASALIHDLVLVTADQRLLDHAPCEVLRER